MSDATGTYGDLTVTVDDDFVATVEIHRPPDNYFDITLIADLARAFEALDSDPAARAAVVCSEGKHFCAGANFTAGSGDGGLEATGRHLYDEAVRLFATKTPAVAAVQGAAIGGGLGLALMPDFRAAAPESRFAANFAKLGFHHGFGMTVTLPAAVGQQRAPRTVSTRASESGARRRTPSASSIDSFPWPMSGPERTRSRPTSPPPVHWPLPRSADPPRSPEEAIRVATDREKAEQNRLQKTTDFREGVRAMTERRPPNFTAT